jgi:hypothetical protein
MHSTLPPKQTDDPHDFVVVTPDLVRVAPADEELSNLVQDLARRHPTPQTHTRSDLPAAPPVPPVDTTFRPAAVIASSRRRTMGSFVARTFTALLLAACTGVAAIGWQSHGETAKAMIAEWAPQLVPASSQLLEKLGLSAQSSAPAIPPAVEAAANDAPPQGATVGQTAPEAVAPVAAPSPDSTQSLQSMARDLASVEQEMVQLKASIAELKASQQQMARDVAKASEQKSSSDQNAGLRLSALPPRPAIPRPRKPIPFPPAQAAAAPPSPQAAAPYVPRRPEPPPQVTAPPPADPELSSPPRPPLPVR